MANTKSLTLFEEERYKSNQFIIEGQDIDLEVFQSGINPLSMSIATAASLESAEGVTAEFVMDGQEVGGFYDGFSGEVPKSLDDLVDLLDIKETPGTAGSHDIQHFSTFASEDMWPI